MPIQWIQEPGHERIESYFMRFDNKEQPSCGFAFDCDKDGNIIGNEYGNAEQRKREIAEIAATQAYHGPYFTDCSHDYYNPGSLRCHCGREHFLARGDSTCECGQDYNACGQQLNPPHMWEENYEED